MRQAAGVGREAVRTKGWLRAHRWLLLRRGMQLGVLAVFLLGPLAGIWLVKGNLASSLTLEVLPLTDPYVLLQSLLARHGPALTAVVGAAIVIVCYLLVGGRAYCSWVCPVNVVTDLAAWLRARLGITAHGSLARSTRYWLLGGTLVLALATGTVVWEAVNPVSMLHRGLIFGMGLGWLVVLGVFLFDLLVSRRGWCGRLCPMGAFYSLLAIRAPLRVRADRRSECDDCMDCYAVCPEPQVIRPALKGPGPVIGSVNCTNCGRCIDVCPKEVFHFGLRIPSQVRASAVSHPAPRVARGSGHGPTVPVIAPKEG